VDAEGNMNTDTANADSGAGSIREVRGGNVLFRLIGRKLRIVVDQERRKLRFEHCLRSRGFWNLIPTAAVECSCDDISDVSLYSRDGKRMIEVQIPSHYGVFIENEVDNFDALVEVMEQFSKGSAPP
jgi:hypothetical protein